MSIWHYGESGKGHHHTLPARLVGAAIAAEFAPNELHRLSIPVRGWLLWQHEPRDRRPMQWRVRPWRPVLPTRERATTHVPSRDVPSRWRCRPGGEKLHPVRAWDLQP